MVPVLTLLMRSAHFSLQDWPLAELAGELSLAESKSRGSTDQQTHIFKELALEEDFWAWN